MFENSEAVGAFVRCAVLPSTDTLVPVDCYARNHASSIVGSYAADDNTRTALTMVWGSPRDMVLAVDAAAPGSVITMEQLAHIWPEVAQAGARPPRESTASTTTTTAATLEPDLHRKFISDMTALLVRAVTW